MYLLTVASGSGGGLTLGDSLIQFVVFIFIIAMVAAVVLLFSVRGKKNNQLNRIEEKVDRLLKEEERKQ